MGYPDSASTRLQDYNEQGSFISIMALFGNQNKKSIEELENYYSGKQQRSGMAWVMAFLSLVITIAVLGGLFFSGRWAYRTFIEDDTSSDIVNTDEPDIASVAGSNTEATDPAAAPAPTPTPTPTPSPSSGGTVSDEAASTSVPNNSSAATNSSNETSSSTGSAAVSGASTNSTTPLPNTGSSSEILIVIAAIATLSGGYLGALRFQIKRI